MSRAMPGVRTGALLPAPACDLLDRLTSELDIPFTLTDLHGTVVASTGGQRAGVVNHAALAMLENSGATVADAEGAAAPTAVYLPVRLSGRISGVLITHGEPADVEQAAKIAAVSIGLALDFSEAAASIARDSVSPGWLLYRLLRGSREEAQQARIIAAIYGWNLCVQRAAIVVLAQPTRGSDEPREFPTDAVQQLLNSVARSTPFGQISDAQWVILMEHEPTDSRDRLRQLTERVRSLVAAHGYDADIGIGEPHLPVNPIAALRRSYREAIYAARLGPKLQDDGAGVYELRALGPAAFFAPSSPSRRNLAAVVLDPLRNQPAAFDTLRTYLACNMSVAETAATLELHRHTVRNHLERVFNLTALDPRTLEGAVQLKLALLVAESDPDVGERWSTLLAER